MDAWIVAGPGQQRHRALTYSRRVEANDPSPAERGNERIPTLEWLTETVEQEHGRALTLHLNA